MAKKLSLDEFEFEDTVEQAHYRADYVDEPLTGEFIRYMERIKKACVGTLSAEEAELLELEKKIMPADGIVHDTALNDLISSFAEIISASKNQEGLKQIRLRTVSNENMPEGFFSMEYLGYYDSYNAEIVLCPERISKRLAKLLKQNRHITTRELYVVVLVNALAHALMDPTKVEGKSNQYQPLITTINKFSEREVLMENSLANMITLQYFEKLGKPEVVRYGEVRELIELQSLPYKFGLDQYDILKPDWRPWREAKRNTKFIKDK
jgi:hypothetical protein